MSWPPPNSKPPVPPAATPAPKPRPQPVSPAPSPGESKVKPQAKATAPTPPQFGHDGIDPLRAALILGVPVVLAGGALLVMFASPLVWWIAGGVAAAGVVGGVVLRRSTRARGLLKRMPGAGAAASALRRTRDGRFSRSPLGRVFNRALGRRPASSSGSTAGGSPSRPKTLGGRLRSMLPAWAGGTRPKRPGGSAGGPPGGSRASRFKSMLSRLKHGGRRPGSASGGAAGGRPGSSPNGSKSKTGSFLGRASRAAGRATRAAGSALFRVRPGTSPSKPSGSGKPGGKSKNKPSGSSGSSSTSTPLDLGVVWTGLGAGGRLVGRGVGALVERLRKRHKADQDDEEEFDPSQTYETGIEGTKVNGEHQDPHLERQIAEAKAEAKRLRKAEKKAAKQAPEWPNLDYDDVPLPPVEGPLPAPQPDLQPPPDYEPDLEDGDDEWPPEISLPVERDRHPPPVSPPSHRETRGEEPRITSTNTRHGGTMTDATNYVEMIDNSTPSTLATTCREAGDQARRDAGEKEEEAKKLRHEASTFDSLPGGANKATAQKLRSEAASCEEDARSRLHWASRLDGMANDAEAKLAS